VIEPEEDMARYEDDENTETSEPQQDEKPQQFQPQPEPQPSDAPLRGPQNFDDWEIRYQDEPLIH
jgi:hypothetical protein